MNREMLILALYQVTGRGTVYSLDDIKAMTDKELNEQFNHYSNLKTLNSRRDIS